MVQVLVVTFILVVVVATVFAVALMALAMLAMACVVGLPAYFLLRPKLQQFGIGRKRESAMERLKNLYVEGKIDLFEFERRAATLIGVEH